VAQTMVGTRSLIALAVIAALGCVLASHGVQASPASAPPDAAEAMGDVLPIEYGKVILQRGFGNARLEGPIVLDSIPNDFDDTYLAHRAVDKRSLSAAIRSKQGKRITVFRRDGTTCSPMLGKVVAYGWALPTAQDAPAWEAFDERTMARKAFTEGTRILAAAIGRACKDGIWATLESPSALRFHSAYAASDSLAQAALAALPGLPTYAKWQSEYERFKVQEEARLRQAGVAPERWHLPDRWSELKPWAKHWVVDGKSPEHSLLVSYVRVGVPGYFASMVAVWWVDAGPAPRLTFIGPDGDEPSEVHDVFTLQGSIGDGKSPPRLLYSTNLRSGGLRIGPNGHYRVDPSPGISPVVRQPPILTGKGSERTGTP
jgi:hypothetical protein